MGMTCFVSFLTSNGWTIFVNAITIIGGAIVPWYWYVNKPTDNKVAKSRVEVNTEIENAQPLSQRYKRVLMHRKKR